ncbi:MAG: glutathione S-transferase family protein [Rhodocyclaceae bacterium]
MKLYDNAVSANAYRARLMLSLLGLKAELKPVDLAQGEQRQDWFLKLNPRGQVPVLDDKGAVIWDSMAIIVYLARRYGGERWLPSDAAGLAEVMQWLAVMENEGLYGLGRARAIVRFGLPGALEQAQALGKRCLAVLETRLNQHDWLALGRFTVADVGCFPSAALAEEGQIALDPYPAVRRWIERVKQQPGYVTLPEPGA